MKHMILAKPRNLKRWNLDTPAGTAHFFTCGRPGREIGSFKLIADHEVHSWVQALQKLGDKLAIVSLLGRKPFQIPGLDSDSEFSFYSFYGGFDPPSENEGRSTFQQWLKSNYETFEILIREHPTMDHGRMSPETLDAIVGDIKELISMGRTVVVVDSGGETRTGQVCKHIGAKKM